MGVSVMSASIVRTTTATARRSTSAANTPQALIYRTKTESRDKTGKSEDTDTTGLNDTMGVCVCVCALLSHGIECEPVSSHNARGSPSLAAAVSESTLSELTRVKAATPAMIACR